jgi:hypothetical protein
MGFYITTVATYLLRNPRRRTFFFTPIVHISSHSLALLPCPRLGVAAAAAPAR